MNRIFVLILTIIFAFVLYSCDLFSDDDSDDDTTLTIINESSYTLTNILWNGFSLTDFGNYLGSGMRSPQKNISAGSGYIHFWVANTETGNIEHTALLRTQQVLTVEAGEKIDFSILNNTIVVDNEDNTIIGTLNELAKVTTLTIRNDSSHIITDVRWNNIYFPGSPNNSDIWPGQKSLVKLVSPGSAVVRLVVKNNLNEFLWSQQEMVVVEKMQNEFVISNNTIFMDADDDDNTLNYWATK